MKLKVFALFLILFGVGLFTNCGGSDSANSEGNAITTQSPPTVPNDQAQPDSTPPSDAARTEAQPKQLPQTASNWANWLVGGATLIAAAAVLRYLK